MKWLIRTLPIATAERLAHDSLICHYPADIRKLVRLELDNLGLDELFK